MDIGMQKCISTAKNASQKHSRIEKIRHLPGWPGGYARAVRLQRLTTHFVRVKLPNPAKKKYSTNELELLAVVLATELFRS